MSIKVDVINEKTFEIIHSAVNKMVDMIRPTFGAASNKVIIDKIPYRMVVDDGVQIARDFELPDPAENAIVKLVREVAIKTNDRVGDGTTGALIILQAIINETFKKRNHNGRQIELELKKGLEEVRVHLLKSSKQIKTKEELKKVALVSFDDDKIAEMIADLYYTLGIDALITLDFSSTMETVVEKTNGVRIDRGYISPYMVTNPDRMEAAIEKPYILITDYRLTENADLFPLMEKMAAANKKGLVIIAENVEQQALATLVINLPQVVNPQTRQLGNFPSVAINLPAVEDRKVFLEDLAILTGAKVFSESKGDKLQDATLEDLGRADKFISRQESSIIICPKGKRGRIAEAVSSLQNALKIPAEESKLNVLKYRLGMFKNTLAIIKVGAATDNERKTLKYKVEDAVNSTKAAFKGGVVCGAGLALSNIKTSSSILNEALKYPSRQLMENMNLPENLGLDEDHVMNVVTGKVGPFMSVGVMDSSEVLIAAVESAVSIAGILLTSTGIIIESQKDNK